jgi:hypothetical protein
MWEKSFAVASPLVAVDAYSVASVPYSVASVAYSNAYVAHSDWVAVGAGEGLDQAAPSFLAEEVELDGFVAP